MPPVSNYSPLKNWVDQKGGIRLSANARVRDRLVEWAVEEFPLDADPEHGAEVLAARLRLRVRKQHGSLIGMAILSILANLVARLVWEWWQNRHSHRVLLEGWQARAKENPDL